MPHDKPYIPLDERVHQDLIHDNLVPKYSALATARPTRLVLIGVWLLFGAWPLAAVAMLWEALTGKAEIIGRLFDTFVGVLIFFISTVNLTRVPFRRMAVR